MPGRELEREIIYEGIPASPGIAISPIHVMARGFSAPEVYEIDEEDVPREQERFRDAVDLTKNSSSNCRTGWRASPVTPSRRSSKRT